jgi:4-hydroxy-3-methylbut-2-enyl diphosphate reductase
MSKNIVLVKPRGFCAGVTRAVEIVEKAIEKWGSPVYVKHEIVHNAYVVDELKSMGAVFVESLDEVPENHRVIFSAHGVPPKDYRQAQEMGLSVIDATCPLVTRVHKLAEKYSKEGYTILLLGHEKHVEVIGTVGVAPENTIVIDNVEKARSVQVGNEDKVAVLCQTTLSVDDTSELIGVLEQRFPRLMRPDSADVCYATTNRQIALKKLCTQADFILVVGGRNSSNSNRLKEVANRQGIEAKLIERAEQIEASWLNGVWVIGITAGASTPECLVTECLEHLKKFDFELSDELVVAKENLRFGLPKDLDT